MVYGVSRAEQMFIVYNYDIKHNERTLDHSVTKKNVNTWLPSYILYSLCLTVILGNHTFYIHTFYCLHMCQNCM